MNKPQIDLTPDWFDRLPAKWRRTVTEIVRLALLFVLFYALTGGDMGIVTTLSYSVGLLVFHAVFSHLLRRILFPYLNLRDYAKVALESPLAAAIVFSSICGLLAVFIVVGHSILMGAGR